MKSPIVRRVTKRNVRVKTKINLSGYKCAKCNYAWLPRRIDIRPKKCPNCNNPKWETPYKAKNTWQNKGLPPGYMYKGRRISKEGKIMVGDANDEEQAWVELRDLIHAMRITKKMNDISFISVVEIDPMPIPNELPFVVEEEKYLQAINMLKDEKFDTLKEAYDTFRRHLDGKF